MAPHNGVERNLDVGTAFLWAAILNTAYVLIEALFGFWADRWPCWPIRCTTRPTFSGLLIAWSAVVVGRRQPTERHTYGLGRATILAALVNGIALLIAVGAIAREAIGRIATPESVAATTVLWVAAIGIAVNSGTALLFLKGRLQDINIRGAFLHMAADAAVSAGVVISALAVIGTGRLIIDPIVALLVSAVVAWSAFALIKSAIHLSLDGVPEGVSRGAIEAWLRALPGVVDLHDLHIWALSTTLYALTVHLVMPGGCTNDAFLESTARELESRFGIKHTTLQIEQGSEAECRLMDPARP